MLATIAGTVLTVLATLYALAALLCRPRTWQPPPVPPVPMPVTVLKPLCGAEARLAQNLETLCVQTHPCYQIVFGVRTPDDPAVRVVQAVIARHPALDVKLVVDPRVHGSNLKVSNLVNMAAAARHPWLVLADSDIAVAPDYLERVTAPLGDPQVGIVTCLYTGRAVGGFWSRVGALFIDSWFAPSVAVASRGGSSDFGFGATIALRAGVLRMIGGFEALKDRLADDFRLGQLTRRRGLATVLSEVVVSTDVDEERLSALWRRERRWMQTIRSLNAPGYAFCFITFTVPMLALGLWLAPAPWNWTLAAVGLLARLRLHWRARPGLPGLALAPLRDGLLLLEWLSAFAGRTTRWRGHRLLVDRHLEDNLTEGEGIMMKTLFLQAPSFDGFDGGAGSRYQARREIRSFWYPTWLAQPAALVPGSRLLDAPADGLSVEQTLDIARDYALVIIHTSTPSFPADARFAELIKERRPDTLVGMVGAKVAVDPGPSLGASRAIDFVAREEFDYTCRDVAAGLPLAAIDGISWRAADGAIRHNPPRAMIEDMDALPFVAPVYRRDLNIRNYFIGYLNYPYVSLYTGRGCRSRCTFCLWPQTVGGHRYRIRSAASVLEEVAWIKEHMPEVKEIMFDDDTFTDFRPRAEEIARGLGRLGVTWSCNAKANVPYPTLKIMKDNGLRLLLVGYESGDDQILLNIKKGLRTDIARRFAADCRELGITVHGTFILGLPGETRETIAKSIEFAKEINPHTIQVSLAAPYPGTRLYEQALENDWIPPNKTINLVNESGVQLAALNYPHLSSDEMYHSLEQFYRSFYFRPSKIWEIVREMLRSWQMTKRRLREGVEFFRFLRAHGAEQA